MAFNLNAQDFISHSVSPTTALKPQIKLNREEFFNSIFKEYEGIEQDKVLLNNYAAYCYKNCLKMLASNKEYESWQEGEKYLEKIVKETFSSRYPSHPIRIKIVRDASNNAAAYEDGTVYVNAGFLVHAETEAELAALLAHEIGHVVLHHNLDGYKSYQNYVTGTSIGNAAGGLSGMLIKYLSRNDLSHHSIRDEEAADLFAINALKKSN
ncbi:MAG: tetratricopeptide repeat protein, partial [Bacteroidetes bacterium]|nr:tetratricopeptide repeat protein [Bacteroidota bacterium]